MKMEGNQNSGFADTFLSKLKEQSFTIIILVGIMYYQNVVFTNQMNEYKKMINEKEQRIDDLEEWKAFEDGRQSNKK